MFAACIKSDKLFFLNEDLFDSFRQYSRWERLKSLRAKTHPHPLQKPRFIPPIHEEGGSFPLQLMKTSQSSAPKLLQRPHLCSLSSSECKKGKKGKETEVQLSRGGGRNTQAAGWGAPGKRSHHPGGEKAETFKEFCGCLVPSSVKMKCVWFPLLWTCLCALLALTNCEEKRIPEGECAGSMFGAETFIAPFAGFFSPQISFTPPVWAEVEFSVKYVSPGSIKNKS